MSKIKIFTDSTSDIPKKIQEEYGIEVLPLTILDGEDEYADGISMTPYEFYDFLESKEKLPSTSRPTPGKFTNVYMKAWKEGYSDFIYVSINSKGSSTYQGAVLEMEDFYEENPNAKDDINIHVIDSLTYSMGYGFAVIEGAKAIRDGKDAKEVIEIIKNWLSKCRIYFVPMNLKYVKKSGRVSAAAAFVGDALGLKPVITFEDGESKVISKIRGEKKIVSEISKMVMENREKNTPYIIATSMNKEFGEKFVSSVSEAIGQAPDVVFPVGAIISINSGPDVVGVIFREK